MNPKPFRSLDRMRDDASHPVQESLNDRAFERDVYLHISEISVAMVGVCLTGIGLTRIVIGMQKINTIADDLLAFDSLIFLTSCLTAYFSLRSHSVRRIYRLERIADLSFIIGMVLMVFVCGLIVSSKV